VPEIAHPVAVRSVTLKLTSPIPPPPLVTSDAATPVDPVVEVSRRVTWGTLANVTVVSTDDIGT
jgi:hypothetical protein